MSASRPLQQICAANLRRDERTKVGTNEEAASPDVDLPGALMKEEHVVDDTETNDLWRSAKEALECSAGSEASIVSRTGSANRADQGEKLRPEENRSTTVALAERDGKETARALHEDGAGD